MKKVIEFEVEFEFIEDEETGEILQNPSNWFIEGCLSDLKDSHGLECLNIKINELKR